MKNFWEKLSEKKKPFFCLAPMADVTDSAFRQIITRCGKPDVFFTEFVSCDGLCSVGQEKLLKDLEFAEIERPLVVQLFGARPENFYKSAQLVAKLGFDGIDINMGCPQKNILKQGAGADLIQHFDLAKEIIRATKKGAGKLPVSIKTRIGFNKNEIEKWLPILLAEKPVAVTIHGRTKKEMSKIPAHWDIIERGVAIAKGSGVLIIGNGDVKSVEDGERQARASGVAGVMIGRAIFGNPWLFNLEALLPNKNEKLKVLLEHLKLFEKLYGETEKKETRNKFQETKKIVGRVPKPTVGRSKPFNLMKKHIKSYLTGFDGAKELRLKLMEASNGEEAKNILQ
ncbi:MAG: tRNA-dihydrouridine synthase [Patescibacteria group bacterium]